MPTLKYSIWEYLASEEKSLEKHEFYRGDITAMPTSSIRHHRIVGNAMIEIDTHIRTGGNCQIFISNLRIHSTVNSLFTYPDLSIVCGDIETLENRNDVVTNPSVLIEVLSESTQDYDRGGKFKLYRDISSLKEYILISSLEMLVEKYSKQEDGTWVLHEYKNDNDLLPIATIDFQIKVKDLYRDVEFAIHS